VSYTAVFIFAVLRISRSRDSHPILVIRNNCLDVTMGASNITNETPTSLAD
jgi:hypothetical protein